MTFAVMEVYDALKGADVADEKARGAAEALDDVAGRSGRLEDRLGDIDKRLTRVEAEIVAIRGELGTMRWIMGLNTALVAGVLLKLLIP